MYGRMGGPYDRWVEPTDRSPLGRVQQQYWTTKQTLMRKLGKKEDEHVVASDSELDAKLEMYNSIDETCLDLDRLLGFYQDQLCGGWEGRHGRTSSGGWEGRHGRRRGEV